MRYLRSLVDPLKRRGEVVHVLGNRNLLSGLGELAECEAAFTLRCEEEPFVPGVDPTSKTGTLRVHRRRSELFHADLNRIADRHAIGNRDVVLINSLRHWSLGDVVDWLEGRHIDDRPMVIIVLHYTPFPHIGIRDPAESGYRKAFQRIANSEVRCAIQLCTDSARLQAEYQSLYDIAVHLVPIPHCPMREMDNNRGGGPLSIGFAGEARPSKGFHLLPGMVRRVREGRPDVPVSFTFQTYGADAEALKALSAVSVVHPQTEPLDDFEYEAFIAGIDLMLIPYVDGSYRSQTSGVFCESAAMGIPAIVPCESWMSDQIAASGAGATFRAGDEEDLTRACIAALDAYPQLRDRARKAATAWRAYHNAANFCETIIRLVDG